MSEGHLNTLGVSNMFNLKCGKCGGELSEPGALLFGPPTSDGWLVEKYHLCHECWLATIEQVRPVTQRNRGEQERRPTRSNTTGISEERRPISVWLNVLAGVIGALVVGGMILGGLVYWDSMNRY